MLQLALELCEAINRFATLDKRYLLYPSLKDWDNLNALVGYLKVFYDATMKLSGTKYPTLRSSYFPFIVQMGKEMFEKMEYILE
jgi:hypothetical protein